MVEFRLFHYSSVSLSAVINYYGLDRRGISSAPTARGTTFTESASCTSEHFKRKNEIFLYPRPTSVSRCDPADSSFPEEHVGISYWRL